MPRTDRKESDGPLTITRMARQSRLSEQTLCSYEKIGLTPPVPRDNSSGRRRYDPNMVRMIELLSCLRSAGLSKG